MDQIIVKRYATSRKIYAGKHAHYFKSGKELERDSYVSIKQVFDFFLSNGPDSIKVVSSNDTSNDITNRVLLSALSEMVEGNEEVAESAIRAVFETSRNLGRYSLKGEYKRARKRGEKNIFLPLGTNKHLKKES